MAETAGKKVQQYQECANTAQVMSWRHNKIESNELMSYRRGGQMDTKSFFSISAKQIIKNSFNSEADTHWTFRKVSTFAWNNKKI